MGAGTKRKEDPSSSNPGKKQKTSVSQEYSGQGQGYQDQGQDGTFSQAGQMMCYFCRQPGHFLSHPNSRSDSIGRSEPSSGCETLYWDSLPDFFFFKAELAPVGMAHIL